MKLYLFQALNVIALLVLLIMSTGCAAKPEPGSFLYELGRTPRLTPQSVTYLLGFNSGTTAWDPDHSKGESLFDVRK